MAPIAIVFSCMIGFLTGLVQFAFLGASLWQAFITYFGVSITLSMLGVAAAVVADHRRSRVIGDASEATLESWQDWQAEEEMEAERLANLAESSDQATRISRKSA